MPRPQLTTRLARLEAAIRPGIRAGDAMADEGRAAMEHLLGQIMSDPDRFPNEREILESMRGKPVASGPGAR